MNNEVERPSSVGLTAVMLLLTACGGQGDTSGGTGVGPSDAATGSTTATGGPTSGNAGGGGGPEVQPPRKDVKYAVIAGANHMQSWTVVYGLSHGDDIYTWFLQFSG